MKAKTKEVRGKLKNAILSLSETQLTQFTRTLFLRYGDLDFVDMEEERSIAQSLSFQIEGDDDYLEWVMPSGDKLREAIASNEEALDAIETMLANVSAWLAVDFGIPTFNPRHPYPFWEAIAENIRAIATP